MLKILDNTVLPEGFRENSRVKAVPASRTFAHRTLAHKWYFIDTCQVKRPF